MRKLVLSTVVLLTFCNTIHASESKVEDDSLVANSQLLSKTLYISKSRVDSAPDFAREKTLKLGSSLKLSNQRNEDSYVLFKTDGINLGWVYSLDLVKDYCPEIDAEAKAKGFYNLENGLENLRNAYYFLSDKTTTLGIKKGNLSDCVFDIGGTLKLRTLNLQLDGVMFWPMGAIRLISELENCPIAEIKIMPANSQYPTVISGHILFSEKPSIFLEGMNISWITMRMK